MDGLECSEILKSELEFSGRIDAEYYQKKYLAYQDIINRHDVLPLFKIADFLIGPFGSAYDTSSYVEQSDYRYIRGQDVKRKGQILRSTPNTAPLICGACNTQPEGLSTMA